MNRAFRTGVAVTLASLLAPGLTAAQPGLGKRDDQGPVSVTVTLIEAPATGSPVKVTLRAGAREVRIAVRNVGGVGERSFTWDLPIGR